MKYTKEEAKLFRKILRRQLKEVNYLISSNDILTIKFELSITNVFAAPASVNKLISKVSEKEMEKYL